MKRLLFLCVFAFFLSSCSNNRSSITSIFGKIENISHISIIQPEIAQSPYGLALYDTLLVWIDPYEGKNLSLFDLSNRKEIHRFGFIGQGPIETTAWPKGRKYQKDYFHIYDNQLRKILEFSIEDIAKDTLYQPKALKSFLEQTSISGVIQVNDSLYVGEISHSDSIYALVNDNGQMVFTGYTYPEDKAGNIPFNIKSFAYQGDFYQNPRDYNLLVHVGINGIVIDILKIENDKIVREKLLTYVLPKYKSVNHNGMVGALMDRDNIIGSCSVSVTSDFIYILYADKTTVNENNRSNKRCSDIILVFDWEGKPIKYYKSDIDLYQICISEDDKYMYGVIMNPEVELVKFAL